MKTEKVFAWRLDGGPRVGGMGDSDDFFTVIVVTPEDKILVRDFKELLGSAFTHQGRDSFVGSRTFNSLVKEVLRPKKEGDNRAVPTFRIEMETGFHTWRWELLGEAALQRY